MAVAPAAKTRKVIQTDAIKASVFILAAITLITTYFMDSYVASGIKRVIRKRAL